MIRLSKILILFLIKIKYYLLFNFDSRLNFNNIIYDLI